MPDYFYTASVAIVAAWLTAAFAFFTLINTKHAKTSEFRQQWIDKLREEISTFLSTVLHMCSTSTQINSAKSGVRKNKLRDERDKFYQTVMQQQLSIRLRINKCDKDKQLRRLNILLLAWLDNVSALADQSDYNGCRRCAAEAQETASEILKLEWERVKAGEKAYRYTILTCVPLLIIGLLGICVLAVKILA
ncbi:hypothetical protein M3930_003214 [Vibrio metschnikovii]|nr:hypothetical protein [Vibrio metschnikovii]EKO3636379.1 hypothetical protein [Vibrio metschnikovii]EKO3653508.1 hypothetical protein [Vibrio metschnikovii]